MHILLIVVLFVIVLCNGFVCSRVFMFLLLFCYDLFFFFQAEDGIRDVAVTGVQTCALPIHTER